MEYLLPDALTLEKRCLLQALVPRLASIKGVEAVVLGGSYAQGTQRPESDPDIGIYYHPEESLFNRVVQINQEG